MNFFKQIDGAITNGHWLNWSLPEVVSTRVVTDHNGHRTGDHRPKWSLTQVVTTLAVGHHTSGHQNKILKIVRQNII